MVSKTPPDKTKAESKTERFKDGSRVVTYPDGSMMILESALACSRVLRESGSAVKYPPASEGLWMDDDLGKS
jgi:hypothetical protein